MKTLTKKALMLGCGLILAAPVTPLWADSKAQDATPAKATDKAAADKAADKRSPAAAETVLPQSSKPFVAVSAGQLTGKAVYNHKEQQIGEVEDLAIDVENKRLLGVVLKRDPGLGSAELLTAVPPMALTRQEDRLVLRQSTGEAKATPHFGWQADNTAVQWHSIYDYHGQDRYWNEQCELAQKPGLEPDAGDRKHDRQAAQPPSSTHYKSQLNVGKASKLMGLEVSGADGTKVGKWEDIVVDLGTGRIVLAVVSTGGILGIGEQYHAVPASRINLRYAGAEVNAVLDMTEAALKKAPTLSRDKFSQLSEPEWVRRVYQHYHEPIYWDGFASVSKQPAGEQGIRNQAD